MPPLSQPSHSTEPLKSGSVDVAAALTLLGGNHALYEQVAKSFLDEIKTLPSRLEPVLSAADLSEAARTLHTFKGLSLTVGAVHLGESCRLSELEIKASLGTEQGLNASDMRRISLRVRESVTDTRRALEAALNGLVPSGGTPSDTREVSATQSGTADLIADLRELESLLRQSDMRAVDVHKRLWQAHGAAAQGRLDALNAALSAFDFERGVVQCEELIREFSASN